MRSTTILTLKIFTHTLFIKSTNVPCNRLKLLMLPLTACLYYDKHSSASIPQRTRFVIIIRNRWLCINFLSVGVWQYWHSGVCKSIGRKLNGYCFTAEHKWSVNLSGLPSGTLFMMWFRSITGIPDSYQGVSHLISQPILLDFEVTVCARIKFFWHSVLHSSSKR